jgi:hypothetical protein
MSRFGGCEEIVAPVGGTAGQIVYEGKISPGRWTVSSLGHLEGLLMHRALVSTVLYLV